MMICDDEYLIKNLNYLDKVKMKLKKFLLRYYPPGILLEYVRNSGEVETKSIDLLNLSPEYYCPKSELILMNWLKKLQLKNQ